MAALVFDLDGTLANSKKCINASIQYAFEQMGFGSLKYCQVQVTQQDLQKSYRQIMEDHGHPFIEAQMHSFIDHYRWYHCEKALDLIELYPGVENVLDQLSSDFQLAVATTKHSEQAFRVLKKLNIDHYFDHIQGTDPGLRYKPEPDILFASLKQLQKSAHEAAYMGDSLSDMHAAKASGMKSIGAAYGFAGDEHLRSFQPDWMVYKIEDLLPLKDSILKSFFREPALNAI